MARNRRYYRRRERMKTTWITLAGASGGLRLYNDEGGEIETPSSTQAAEFVQGSPFGITNEITILRVVGRVNPSAAAIGVLNFGLCNGGRPFCRVNCIGDDSDNTQIMVNQKTRHKVSGANVVDVLNRLKTVRGVGVAVSGDVSLNLLIEIS